jgi:transcriptional regulator with XRE-family HTH domain
MKSTTCLESVATHSAPAVRHIRAGESDALSVRLLELVGEDSLLSFARRCGVNEGTLRNIIKAGAMPRTDHLVAIADAANVSIEWLAAGRGPKQRGASAAAPAPPAESTVNVEDLERLTLAIEAIEEGLGPTRYKLTANRYAQLVAAVYDLLADMDQKSNVLKFIKLAA